MIGMAGAHGAFGLTRGMARSVGVNITDAVVDGWLTRGELADMVERCLSCPHERECLAWLGHTVDAEAVPVFCENKDELESLRITP